MHPAQHPERDTETDLSSHAMLNQISVQQNNTKAGKAEESSLAPTTLFQVYNLVQGLVEELSQERKATTDLREIVQAQGAQIEMQAAQILALTELAQNLMAASQSSADINMLPTATAIERGDFSGQSSSDSFNNADLADVFGIDNMSNAHVVQAELLTSQVQQQVEQESAENLLREFLQTEQPKVFEDLLSFIQKFQSIVKDNSQQSQERTVRVSDFLEKALPDGLNIGSNACFIAQYKLDSIDQFKQLIQACSANKLLKSVLMHYSHHWENALQSFSDLMWVWQNVNAYTLQSSQKHKLGDYAQFSGRRNKFCELCQQGLNSDELLSVLMKALHDNNYDLVKFIYQHSKNNLSNKGKYEVELLLVSNGQLSVIEDRLHARYDVYKFSGVDLVDLIRPHHNTYYNNHLLSCFIQVANRLDISADVKLQLFNRYDRYLLQCSGDLFVQAPAYRRPVLKLLMTQYADPDKWTEQGAQVIKQLKNILKNCDASFFEIIASELYLETVYRVQLVALIINTHEFTLDEKTNTLQSFFACTSNSIFSLYSNKISEAENQSIWNNDHIDLIIVEPFLKEFSQTLLANIKSRNTTYEKHLITVKQQCHDNLKKKPGYYWEGLYTAIVTSIEILSDKSTKEYRKDAVNASSNIPKDSISSVFKARGASQPKAVIERFKNSEIYTSVMSDIEASVNSLDQMKTKASFTIYEEFYVKFSEVYNILIKLYCSLESKYKSLYSQEANKTTDQENNAIAGKFLVNLGAVVACSIGHIIEWKDHLAQFDVCPVLKMSEEKQKAPAQNPDYRNSQNTYHNPSVPLLKAIKNNDEKAETNQLLPSAPPLQNCNGDEKDDKQSSSSIHHGPSLYGVNNVTPQRSHLVDQKPTGEISKGYGG